MEFIPFAILAHRGVYIVIDGIGELVDEISATF
jgi:hypothetical protein